MWDVIVSQSYKIKAFSWFCHVKNLLQLYWLSVCTHHTHFILLFSSTDFSCDNYASFHNNCVSVTIASYSVSFTQWYTCNTYIWLICKVTIHFRMGNVLCELQLSCNIRTFLLQPQRWTRLIDSRGPRKYLCLIRNIEFSEKIKYESFFLRERDGFTSETWWIRQLFFWNAVKVCAKLSYRKFVTVLEHSFVQGGVGRARDGGKTFAAVFTEYWTRGLNVQKRVTRYNATRTLLELITNKLLDQICAWCVTVRDQMEIDNWDAMNSLTDLFH